MCRQHRGGGTERCPPPVGTRRGGGTAGRRAPGVQHSPPYTLHTPPSHPSAQHAALHARNPPRRDSLMADITVGTGGGGLCPSPGPPNPQTHGCQDSAGGVGVYPPLCPRALSEMQGPTAARPIHLSNPPPHKYLQAAGCDAPSIWHGPPWHGQRARSAGRPGTVSLADWCHLPHAGLGMGDKGLPGPGGGARRCAKGSTVPPQGSLPSPPPPSTPPVPICSPRWAQPKDTAGGRSQQGRDGDVAAGSPLRAPQRRREGGQR